MSEKTLIPTRKWLAAQVTAAAALAGTWLTAGEWNKTLTAAGIGLCAQALVAYLTPNADTTGGVPAKPPAPTAAALPTASSSVAH